MQEVEIDPPRPVIVGVHGRRRRAAGELAALVLRLPLKAAKALDVLHHHIFDRVQVAQAQQQDATTSKHHQAALAVLPDIGRYALSERDDDLFDLAPFAAGAKRRAQSVDFELCGINCRASI